MHEFYWLSVTAMFNNNILLLVTHTIFMHYFFTIFSVQCGSLSSNSRITAIFNQTATLVWTVNLDQNQRFSTGLLYLLPDISNPIINARIAVTENGKSLFGDRLSAIYNETEKLYTASLKNVNYNETYTFQLLGIFSNRDEFRRRAIVIANITGIYFCFIYYIMVFLLSFIADSYCIWFG